MAPGSHCLAKYTACICFIGIFHECVVLQNAIQGVVMVRKEMFQVWKHEKYEKVSVLDIVRTCFERIVRIFWGHIIHPFLGVF